MSDRRLGIFTMARASSQRAPNKMLRPFAETSLSEIAAKRLAKLGPDAFFAGRGNEFRAIAERAGVRFVERDERSVSIDGPIQDILSFVRTEPYTHFLIVNGCMPFLRPETVQNFVREAQAQDWRPSFAVVKHHDFFFDESKKPINFADTMKTINSKEAKPVYRFAHALYFFEKSYFLEHGRYWDWREVRLVEIDDLVEIVDIDDERDFRLAELMWKARSLES